MEGIGMDVDLADEWGVSYGLGADQYPILKNRITIPIWGYDTSVLMSIAGRAVLEDDTPKYWHAPWDRSRWLYGLWKIHEAKGERVVALCEGFNDTWAAWEMGLLSLSIMGSHMSPWQAAHVAGITDKAIIIYDEDNYPQQWINELSKFNVKAVAPKGLYPTHVPHKSDPAWMFVNRREWLKNYISVAISQF